MTFYYWHACPIFFLFSLSLISIIFFVSEKYPTKYFLRKENNELMDGTSTNTSDATVQLTDCGLKAQAHCTVSQSTHVANHLVRGCEEHACMCTPHHKSSRKMKRGSLMFVAAPSGRRSVMGELCNYKPINTTHIHAHTHAHTQTHTITIDLIVISETGTQLENCWFHWPECE